jgi:hypothetical protein
MWVPHSPRERQRPGETAIRFKPIASSICGQNIIGRHLFLVKIIAQAKQVEIHQVFR